MEDNPTFLKIEGDFWNRKAFPFEIYYAYTYPFYPTYEYRFIEYKVKDISIYVESPALEIFFKGLEKKKYYTEDLTLLNNENLQSYLIVYQEGFLKGYHEFDSHIKNSVGIFQTDKESIINTIFDVAYTHISGLSIYEQQEIENTTLLIIKKSSWFDSGFKAGKKYKAWFYIINNPQNFVRLFRTDERLIKFYHRAAQVWKEEEGGEGIYSHITNLLQEIDYTVQIPPSPTHESQGVKKEIYISKERIEPIYNALVPYFTGQEKELRQLLEGKTIVKPLDWSKNANQLTHIFWGAKRRGWIIDTNAQICDWILRNFRYNNGKTFDRDNVTKNLNTQETRCRKPLPDTDF